MINYKYNTLITENIENELKKFRSDSKLGKGNSNILKIYKNSLPKLSNYQKETLIGLVLGDASLDKGRLNSNVRVKFDYSKKHSAYAFHIAEVFRHWILTEPTERFRKNSDYVGLGFQTIRHSEFDYLKDLFLLSNKKSVPQNLIRDYLTPVGLAYWFMDDGGKIDYGKNKGKGIEFHTGGFSDNEVTIMVKELSEKFELNCWKAYNRKYPIIRISGKDFEKVISLIKPYIIPEMSHKLPVPRKIKENKS